jgi:hypothetical protein
VLKGTRDGILKKIQPVSIHGQVSWDVFFADVEDPDGQVTVARIGPEAVIGNNLEPGDRIQVEYLVGQAVASRASSRLRNTTAPQSTPVSNDERTRLLHRAETRADARSVTDLRSAQTISVSVTEP